MNVRLKLKLKLKHSSKDTCEWVSLRGCFFDLMGKIDVHILRKRLFLVQEWQVFAPICEVGVSFPRQV